MVLDALRWVIDLLLLASVFVLACRLTGVENRQGASEDREMERDPVAFGLPVPDLEAEALVRDCADDDRLHVPVTEGGKSCQNCRAVLA